MAGKIKAMWTNKDIRNRILFTLFAFLVYRLGSAITVPDVNTADLVNGIGENSLFAMLNLLGGGGLEQFSVFALGVTPYITASIIIQLLSMDVIPHLTELSKAGANGRKTLDKYTRYLAVVFAFVQSFSLVYGFSKAYTGLIVGGVTISKILYIATIFAAGSMFLVWIGDQISMKGIGNGISLLIMAGIIQSMPSMFVTTFQSLVTSGTYSTVLGSILFALFVMVYILIILGVVFIQLAERRVPIQYSNRTNSAYGAQTSYLPIKLNPAGVMPVIFAQTLLAIPTTIVALVGNDAAKNFVNNYITYTSPTGFILYVILILFFGYFYTFMEMNPEEMSKNLNKNGGYIPGVRPGADTTDYISKVIGRLTIVGSIFLVIIAGLPIIFSKFSGLPSSVTIGGTGLLIVVGVAIETYKQLESSLVSRSYREGRRHRR